MALSGYNPPASGGSSSGSSSSSSGTTSSSSTPTASSATTSVSQKSINRAKTYYLNLLAGWGVKRTKAVNKLINKLAARAENYGTYSSARFQRAVASAAPRAWLSSTTGKERVAKAQQQISSIFGETWSESKDKQTIALAKKYAKNPALSEDWLYKNLLSTKQGKAEFAFYGDFAGEAGMSMAQKMASYKAYEKMLNDELSRAGVDPAADATLFFRSGVSKEDFSARISDYLSNRGAFATVMGRGLTEAERQSALYGQTAEGEAQRQGLARAAEAVKSFTPESLDAFERVLGRSLTAAERQNIIYGDIQSAQRSLAALGRAADVEATVRQTTEAQAWQTGGGLTQAQREGLMYNTAEGQEDLSDLKRAFSLKSSWSKGSATGFGLGRAASGQVVVQGI